MTLLRPVEYEKASDEVREVYDEMMALRGTKDVAGFWKYLANDPATLRRTWNSIREVMGPGELEPMVKEMIYLAAAIAYDCDYCIQSHARSAKAAGMSNKMMGELMAIVAMAAETKSLNAAFQVPLESYMKR